MSEGLITFPPLFWDYKQVHFEPTYRFMQRNYVSPQNAKKIDLTLTVFSNFQNFFYSLNVVAHGIRMLEPVVLRASRSRCASAAFLSG